MALARSLVLEPKILLLDEPFASLDQHLRERLREEVRDLQQRLRITTLFVTHGQDEALALADRIVVMRDGRTEQIAPPDVVYREPATPFVAGFIGTMNLIDGTVEDGSFRHSGFALPVPLADGPATLAVRPEALDIAAPGPGAATVHRVTDYGTHAIVDIELADGLRLKSMVADARAWSAGLPVDFGRAPSPSIATTPRSTAAADPDGGPDLGNPRWSPHVPQVAPRPPPGSDPVFTGRRILEGMAAGASVEVDLVVHADAASPCSTTCRSTARPPAAGPSREPPKRCGRSSFATTPGSRSKTA